MGAALRAGWVLACLLLFAEPLVNCLSLSSMSKSQAEGKATATVIDPWTAVFSLLPPDTGLGLPPNSPTGISTMGGGGGFNGLDGLNGLSGLSGSDQTLAAGLPRMPSQQFGATSPSLPTSASSAVLPSSFMDLSALSSLPSPSAFNGLSSPYPSTSLPDRATPASTSTSTVSSSFLDLPGPPASASTLTNLFNLSPPSNAPPLAGSPALAPLTSLAESSSTLYPPSGPPSNYISTSVDSPAPPPMSALQMDSEVIAEAKPKKQKKGDMPAPKLKGPIPPPKETGNAQAPISGDSKCCP